MAIRYSTLSDAIANIPSLQDSNSPQGRGRSKEAVEIWCTKCFDDPTIELCAFCGCKMCFGKNQPNLLILCDHCNRETHSFCLRPPLNSVPSTDPWCCESCAKTVPKASELLHEIIPAPDDEHDFGEKFLCCDQLEGSFSLYRFTTTG